MTAPAYPKRLIEVDLPIKEISAHARREKTNPHGNITTLHIWWARRPLAACRAVILASLWPDPADPNCPEMFRAEAARQMRELRDRIGGPVRDWTDPLAVRAALLAFIAGFSSWDRAHDTQYLETSRALVRVAHEALGGSPGTRPLVVDPFAGGGSIPLEALRIGADAFASDLNPVAVLLNKVVLEYVPKHGAKFADGVRRWGAWVRDEAAKELGEFYPADPDGATPIAYLWARTIRCEGPDCGAEVPLMRSTALAKKGSQTIALRIVPNSKTKSVAFEIEQKGRAQEGTVRRGSATCPLCGFTTRVEHVRAQLRERHGGARDARLLCVVTNRPGQQGRCYRLPTERDIDAARASTKELARRQKEHRGPMSLVPNEEISCNELRRISVPIYGVKTWGDLFTTRQALALATFVECVRRVRERLVTEDAQLAEAVVTCLALVIDRLAEHGTSLCRWNPTAETMQATFGRQALPMVWDFAEVPALQQPTSKWSVLLEWVIGACDAAKSAASVGSSTAANSAHHPLPDDSAHAIFTDPPYYDAVPYAHLSDFFASSRKSVGGPLWLG